MTSFKAWAFYALAAAGVVAVAGASAVAAGIEGPALWVGGAIAYVVQLVAFALLVLVRKQPQLFMMAWLAGMLFRFGALGACAFWLSRRGTLPQSTTLLSLVGFLFLLLLLEPLFLRHGRHDRTV
ncbi:MAG: hypothetical protein ACT443_04625 [Gemmatimonadota bacterium]